MKYLLSVLITFFCFNFVYAQIRDSSRISNRISKTDQIQNARKLLLDEIVNLDKIEAKKIANYLLELENENYASFFNVEKWLLGYWFQDFETVITSVKGFQESSNNLEIEDTPFSNTVIFPETDYLYVRLRERIKKEREDIKLSISSSSLSNMEKDFLLLHLDHLLIEYEKDEISQDSLNSYSDIFLEKYPNSSFYSLVKEHIRFVVKPSDWGFAFEFFTGYGVFTDQLYENFDNNVPFGIAFDVQYKNYVLYLRNYIGFGKTSRDIDFNGSTWNSGDQTRIFLPEASLGFELINNNLLKFTPFVGISSTNVAPTEYDIERNEEYENVGLDFTTTYSMGLNLDLKMRKSSSGIVARNESGEWIIRLRYSFNQPQFEKSYTGFSGNIHYITIGFTGFARRLKRSE